MTTPQLRAPHWRLVRGTHPAARFWGRGRGTEPHPKLINTTKLICLGLARYTATTLVRGRKVEEQVLLFCAQKIEKSNTSENIRSTYVGVASWPRREQHNAKQTQTLPQVVRATMPWEGFG